MTKFYQDTNFQAADSPITIDFVEDTGFTNNTVYFYCDGAGDIKVAISYDTTFGDDIVFKSGEKFDFSNHIKKMRITHSGADSSYRVICM